MSIGRAHLATPYQPASAPIMRCNQPECEHTITGDVGEFAGQLRRRAKAAGWRVITKEGERYPMWDLCPDHAREHHERAIINIRAAQGHPPVTERQARVRSLRAQGMTIGQIASDSRVSRSRAYQIYQQATRDEKILPPGQSGTRIKGMWTCRGCHQFRPHRDFSRYGRLCRECQKARAEAILADAQAT